MLVTLFNMPSLSLAHTGFFLCLCFALSNASSPAAVVRRHNDHGPRPAAAVRRHNGNSNGNQPGPDEGPYPHGNGAVKEVKYGEKKESFGFEFGIGEKFHLGAFMNPLSRGLQLTLNRWRSFWLGRSAPNWPSSIGLARMAGRSFRGNGLREWMARYY